jgi:ubiquinone/menaquinone biosynthesis C-methylase UbiE
MAEINLLRSYPKARRNVAARAATKDSNRALALKFGMEYYDGTREQGYGGYRYDGRWKPIARDMIDHWKLGPGKRVIDIGCAKGFLMKDLMDACPGLEVWGLDISDYGLRNAMPECAGKLVRGNVRELPFPDGYFDAAVCINAVHNLPRPDALQAIREIERIAPGKGYIQIDAYRTELEREHFLNWMLTCLCFDTPDGWRDMFRWAGYTGDYYWTIIELDTRALIK